MRGPDRLSENHPELRERPCRVLFGVVLQNSCLAQELSSTALQLQFLSCDVSNMPMALRKMMQTPSLRFFLIGVPWYKELWLSLQLAVEPLRQYDIHGTRFASFRRVRVGGYRR